MSTHDMKVDALVVGVVPLTSALKTTQVELEALRSLQQQQRDDDRRSGDGNRRFRCDAAVFHGC